MRQPAPGSSLAHSFALDQLRPIIARFELRGLHRTHRHPDGWAAAACTTDESQRSSGSHPGGRVAGDVERPPKVRVDVAARLLEVDVSQARPVRPAGCDHHVVGR